MIEEVYEWLCAVTKFDAMSFQPNSGAQGEYAGLLAIRLYHESIRSDKHVRNICLIPRSSHGTNPASAHMAGYDVLEVENEVNGNVSLKDLKQKCE